MSTAITPWTLAQMHRLPDDGNKYELLDGELFVTPAPSVEHQEIISRLMAVLIPYVEAAGTARVYSARAVIRRGESELEPDLYVRPRTDRPFKDWADMPLPRLVVEVLSPYTRRRDLVHKRRFYVDELGIAEYWIVDPESRTMRVVRQGSPDVVVADRWTWMVAGAAEQLSVAVSELFV